MKVTDTDAVFLQWTGGQGLNVWNVPEGEVAGLVGCIEPGDTLETHYSDIDFSLDNRVGWVSVKNRPIGVADQRGRRLKKGKFYRSRGALDWAPLEATSANSLRCQQLLRSRGLVSTTNGAVVLYLPGEPIILSIEQNRVGGDTKYRHGILATDKPYSVTSARRSATTGVTETIELHQSASYAITGVLQREN